MAQNRNEAARRRNHGEPKRFDPRVVKQLEDEGMSPADAVREACTTMGGAYEKPGGGISSFQTLCNVLHYDEALPESPEAEKAKEKTRNDLVAFMRRQFPGEIVNPDNVDEFVDKWLELPDEKRLRE